MFKNMKVKVIEVILGALLMLVLGVVIGTTIGATSSVSEFSRTAENFILSQLIIPTVLTFAKVIKLIEETVGFEKAIVMGILVYISLKIMRNLHIKKVKKSGIRDNVVQGYNLFDGNHNCDASKNDGISSEL